MRAEHIVVKDYTSQKYKLIIFSGISFAIVSAFTWYFNFHELFYYIFALLAIVCFFYLSMDNFRSSNAVTVDNYGATFKLVSRKTFGFQFKDVNRVKFVDDKGLKIELTGSKPILLSQQRYHIDSLKSIELKLNEKISQL